MIQNFISQTNRTDSIKEELKSVSIEITDKVFNKVKADDQTLILITHHEVMKQLIKMDWWKDNEAKRFKKLAVEFARYIRDNPKEVKDYSLTIFEEGKFVSDDVKHYDNIEELFEMFLKKNI